MQQLHKPTKVPHPQLFDCHPTSEPQQASNPQAQQPNFQPAICPFAKCRSPCPGPGASQPVLDSSPSAPALQFHHPPRRVRLDLDRPYSAPRMASHGMPGASSKRTSITIIAPAQATRLRWYKGYWGFNNAIVPGLPASQLLWLWSNTPEQSVSCSGRAAVAPPRSGPAFHVYWLGCLAPEP